MNKWTAYEDSVLSNISLSYDMIQEKFLPHRTKRSIWSRASKLGFKRDVDLIKKINSENQRKPSWTEPLLDKEFCEVVDGELLGDGCIYKKKVKNRNSFEYSFITGSIHKEYAKYVHRMISKKLDSRAKIKTIEPKIKNGYISKKFYSVRFSSVVFKHFYDRWYSVGSIKVRTPKDLKLSPTTCLHWYLGDGSLDSRKDARMFDLSLHTENFTYGSILDLKTMLEDQFNIKVSVSKSSKLYHKLRVHGDHARSFLSKIGPCPLKCFEYKWRDWK